MENYQTFNIPYWRQFTDFYKFDKFEIDFSELVSSDWSEFPLLFCNTIMTNSDKHNNLFCACAIAKFSK